QAGDEVLISFAQCLNKNIRNNVDFLGRYGGEEFLIVLPETNIKGAFSLAERLRIKVSQNTIHTNKKEVYVTASFGFSSLDIPGMSKEITPEDIIRSVDEYLYQAKKEGRNKVIGGPLLLCR
ncbi:MAG: GGDEF domain-containing protein, partial [Thermodesulfobacteriota bacterium]|nr:GGDEF domain-containing protein [Thermodesulfobacteriota bacterium]